MNNKTVKTLMVVAMLFTLSLYFIGGTYARYIGEYTGNATASVAKWKVQLNGKSAEETSMDLTFTPTKSEYVVDGKIAPGSSSTAEVKLDLDGTEVAVDVIAEVTESTLQEKLTELGLTSSEIKFKSEFVGGGQASSSEGNGSKENPYVVKLPSNQAFSTEDTITIKLTLEWGNDEAHNSEDTKAGKNAETLGEISVPVKLTVRQHIDE